jgi:hypothetical protein
MRGHWLAQPTNQIAANKKGLKKHTSEIETVITFFE